jgi:hypothetical protein
MITLELLSQFTQEELRYKSGVKVVSYEIIRDWIQLQFDDNAPTPHIMGELVSVDRFYNWVNEKRDKKINQII